MKMIHPGQAHLQKISIVQKTKMICLGKTKPNKIEMR